MIDKETQKVLTDGEKLKLLSEHDGFAILEKIVHDKVATLQSIFNIDDSKPDRVISEIIGRKLASQLLTEFWDEVVGRVAQHKANIGESKKDVNDWIVSK